MNGVSYDTIDLVLVWTDPPTGNMATSVIPTGERQVGETDEQLAARIAAKDAPPGATGVAIVDKSSFSSDRTFREAWQHVAGQIVVDMVKARLVHRRRLLFLRDLKLRAVTDDLEKAVDDGLTILAAALRVKRRNLRVLETKIDTDMAAIVTIADLKTYKPTELD